MNIEFAKNSISVELIELLDYVIGGDWGKDASYNDTNYDLAFCIRGTEFKNWNEDKGRTASLRKIKKSSIQSKQLKEGDILIEISGGGPEQPVGRTVLIDKAVLAYKPEIPKICTNFIRLARPTKHIDGKYLNLFLTFFYKSGDVVMYQSGSNNLRNLKFDDYTSIKIPLPPLPEQHRIVAKIEELFSSLDKGIESLKTAQQQLKIYRQAVLKWAFDSVKTEASIEEITDNSLIGIVRSNAQLVNAEIGIPYIKMNNVDLNGNVDFENIVYVKVTEIEKERFLLKRGDILINTRNSYELVGKTGIVRDQKIEAVFNNNLLRVRVKKDFNPLFIAYQLISPWLRKQMIKEKKATTNVCALYQRDIFPLKVKVTNRIEQEKIVSEIESRLSVCDKIEESISSALQQAEALRQSILKKAFEGKLVPQDPNDEPASVLLERIKAERAKNKPEKTKRKSRV